MSQELIAEIEQATATLHDIAHQLQVLYDQVRVGIAANERIAARAILEAHERNQERVNNPYEAPPIEAVHAYVPERRFALRRSPRVPPHVGHHSLATAARIDHRLLERAALQRAIAAEEELPPVEDGNISEYASAVEDEDPQVTGPDERAAPVIRLSVDPPPARLPKYPSGPSAAYGSSDDESVPEDLSKKPQKIQLKPVTHRHGYKVGDVVVINRYDLKPFDILCCAGRISRFAKKQIVIVTYTGDEVRATQPTSVAPSVVKSISWQKAVSPPKSVLIGSHGRRRQAGYPRQWRIWKQCPQHRGL